MTLFDCSVTTPPRVEGGAVVFTVLHQPSGEVFLCRMASFEDVNLSLVPKGMTPSAEGEVRGVVAEAALEYARRNAEELAPLFEQALTQSDDSVP